MTYYNLLPDPSDEKVEWECFARLRFVIDSGSGWWWAWWGLIGILAPTSNLLFLFLWNINPSRICLSGNYIYLNIQKVRDPVGELEDSSSGFLPPPPICYFYSSETILQLSFTRERKRSISFSSRRLLTWLCGQCLSLQTVDQWKKTHYFDRFLTRFCLNCHSKNCSFVDFISVKMTNSVVHLSMHPRPIDLTIICPPLFCWFSSIPSPIIFAQNYYWTPNLCTLREASVFLTAGKALGVEIEWGRKRNITSMEWPRQTAGALPAGENVTSLKWRGTKNWLGKDVPRVKMRLR